MLVVAKETHSLDTLGVSSERLGTTNPVVIVRVSFRGCQWPLWWTNNALVLGPASRLLEPCRLGPPADLHGQAHEAQE